MNKKAMRTLFLGVAGCILLYWILHETERVQGILNVAKNIVSPFVIGAALAFVLNVPMRGIENRLKFFRRPALRRMTALVLTLLCFALVLALVFWLLIPQISQTVNSLIPKLVEFFTNLEASIRDFLDNNPKLMEWVIANTDFEKFDWSSLIQKAMSVLGNSITTIANGAFTAIGNVVGTIVNIVIGLVFAFYCLFRKEILARQFRRLLYSFLPEKFCDETIRVFRMTNTSFSNFLSGQCIEVCILGTMFAISMAIFRMPYIPLVSVLVAVTAFVPVVGAFVGCIFGAFFILVDNPIQAVWFVVMFLVLQQIENNLIYPRVVGTSTGLPGMWVLVAITIGGDLMGVGGMLIMIPLTSVVYTLLREITDRRLEQRQIDPDKLRDHPPELGSRLKEKTKKKRERRLLNRKPKKDKK